MSAKQKLNCKTKIQNTQIEYVSGHRLLWIHPKKEYILKNILVVE